MRLSSWQRPSRWLSHPLSNRKKTVPEIREFACWDGPEEAPLVRKWVPLEDYERLSLKCAALAKLAYPPDLLRLRAGLLAHACYCGSSDLDPAVHREDCAYRKWASPEHPTGND